MSTRREFLQRRDPGRTGLHGALPGAFRRGGHERRGIRAGRPVRTAARRGLRHRIALSVRAEPGRQGRVPAVLPAAAVHRRAGLEAGGARAAPGSPALRAGAVRAAGGDPRARGPRRLHPGARRVQHHARHPGARLRAHTEASALSRARHRRPPRPWRLLLLGQGKAGRAGRRASRPDRLQAAVLQRPEHRERPRARGLRGGRDRHVLLGRAPHAPGRTMRRTGENGPAASPPSGSPRSTVAPARASSSSAGPSSPPDSPGPA